MSEQRIRRRRWLPHLEAKGGIYFVTFRLGDSLAKSMLRYVVAERKNIVATAAQARRPPSAGEKYRLSNLSRKRMEEFLDRGAGECHMRDQRVAKTVADALCSFDGERYELFAWCVMPNHVHVVFRPQEDHQLEEIVHSWKSFTAHRANKLLGRTGTFWRREYYDHLIRDGQDLARVVNYVAENPRRAGLDNWPWVELRHERLKQAMRPGVGHH